MLKETHPHRHTSHYFTCINVTFNDAVNVNLILHSEEVAGGFVLLTLTAQTTFYRSRRIEHDYENVCYLTVCLPESFPFQAV